MESGLGKVCPETVWNSLIFKSCAAP
jgi:Flp pilus assembly pilin Flp